MSIFVESWFRNMSEKMRRLCFLSTFVLIVLCVSYGIFKGKNQDQIYKNRYEQYIYAQHLLQEQKANEALPILKKLYRQYPDRYNIMRDLGLAYALAGDFSKASFYYDKALEQRPFLRIDPIFMVQFGEISYFNGEYAKAKVLLEEARQLAGSEKYHQRIDELLTSIQSKSKVR
ncbi:Tetratricopeptide repeat-containing protein [Parageobacillus thermoglucosidasius C56-YS93]|nr:Tetratricopeptide repeat-containing protein [Parageobacillus thermoglucosidasius C56-YS93]